MKRLCLLLVLVLMGVSAYAQTTQGKSSIGFNVGYGFDSKNATLGVDYRYCITDEVRLAKLSDAFGFYPLAGLSLSFWNWDVKHELSHNETRFGANIGLGGEVYASDALSVGLEVKYNIIKDFDQAMFAVRVGYSF